MKVKLRRPHPIRWFNDWRLRARMRRNEKVVERALVRLFRSAGDDQYALKTMIEHALGRRIYNENFLQELAVRQIYGDDRDPR